MQGEFESFLEKSYVLHIPFQHTSQSFAHLLPPLLSLSSALLVSRGLKLLTSFPETAPRLEAVQSARMGLLNLVALQLPAYSDSSLQRTRL